MKIKDILIRINEVLMEYNIVALLILYIMPPFKYLFGNRYNDFYTNVSFEKGLNKEKLLLITNKVKDTTPFYKKNTQMRLNSFGDFERYFKPFGKEILVQHFEDFISSDFSKSRYEIMTTGGTSGPPSQFYVNKSRYKKEYAFYHKIWSVLGYKEHLRGVLRNEKLPKNKVYKINAVTKEVVFDGFRNNETYYNEIYRILLKLKIKYIQGYPSSIYNFFLSLSKNDKDISFIKGVFLSSEVFLEHQRSFLVRELKIPIISVYGHSEKLALAVDFEGNNMYRIIEDYGYLELIDENNHTIKDEGRLGEIVATTFDNLGMPLVRYKTGDYSSYQQYSETGGRILNGIQGRWNEMKIYNKDNSFVTPTALNLHDELNKCINGLQYVQKEKGKLQIHIITNQFYDDKTEKAFYKHYKDRMADNSVIDIHKVKELKQKSNGKFLILESNL